MNSFVASGFTLKHSLDAKGTALIGPTANINYFLKTPLTPDSAEGIVNKTTTRKSASVRRYKGDPAPYTRPGGTVEFMYDPGRIDLQTLPGRPVVLVANGERRQFSLVGDVMDLHAFLVTNAKYDMKLYTQGPPYVILAAEQGG